MSIVKLYHLGVMPHAAKELTTMRKPSIVNGNHKTTHEYKIYQACVSVFPHTVIFFMFNRDII